MSTSFTSDLLAYISGAPVRIGTGSLDGVENASAFVYSQQVELDWRNDPQRHQTLRNLDIAASLNLSKVGLGIEMTLLDKEREEGLAAIASAGLPRGRLIGFHPGAGKRPNRWAADRFAQTANALCVEFKAAAVVTAGPMDDEPVQAMVSALCVPYYVVKNESIRRVASILEGVDLLVSNDTGIMHVGAAVGTPVLSLFGPTEPRQWAPQGPQHKFLQAADGSMDSLLVREVLVAARSMLAAVEHPVR